MSMSEEELRHARGVETMRICLSAARALGGEADPAISTSSSFSLPPSLLQYSLLSSQREISQLCNLLQLDSLNWLVTRNHQCLYNEAQHKQSTNPSAPPPPSLARASSEVSNPGQDGVCCRLG